MRISVLIALFCLLGCRSGAPERRRINIQPIEFTDGRQLHFIQGQLAAFFHCPVDILQPVAMPPDFLNRAKGERYSADLVLRWLSERRSDSVQLTVGLTRKDIFTRKRRDSVWGILGLGGCPGNVCVVSDARFFSTAPKRYEHRLRTLVIHELGHNFGLPHCKSPHCIMNDANEQIATVDSSGDQFCVACRRRLGSS